MSISFGAGRRVSARLIAAAATGGVLAVVAIAGPLAEEARATDFVVSDLTEFTNAVTLINATDGDHTITLDHNIDFTDAPGVQFATNANMGVPKDIVIDGVDEFEVFCDREVGSCGGWIDNYVGQYGSLTIQNLVVRGFGYGAIYTVDTDLNVFDSEFLDNTKIDDYDSFVAGNGAAINDSSSNPETNIVIEDSHFIGNYANAGNSYGGALNLNSDTYISGGTFQNNTARGETVSAQGGAIAVFFANIEIDDVTFTGNQAYGVNDPGSAAGGAIFVHDGYLEVDGVTFDHNGTTGDGGAVQVTNGSGFEVEDSTFSGNSAEDRGGALSVEGSEGGIQTTSFVDNSTLQSGGAVSINSNSAALIYQSLFEGNEAFLGGGLGVFNFSDIEVMSSTFTENAAYDGAAVATSLSSVELNYVTIAGNTADDVGNGGDGGGQIRAQESDIAFHAAVIANVLGGGQENCSFVDEFLDSNDYNFVDDESCALGAPHDVEIDGLDPELGPLQFNGGPTHTMLPSPESPLVDEIPLGDGGPCITEAADQRDVSRPQGEACDIGAVETFEPILWDVPTPNGTVHFRILNAMNMPYIPRYYPQSDFIDPVPPAGVLMPYGGFGLYIEMWDDGWPADVQIATPTPTTELWKLMAHGWSQYPAEHDGLVWSFRLVDGAAGDNDGVADGLIVDPVAPGLTANFTG